MANETRSVRPQDCLGRPFDVERAYEGEQLFVLEPVVGSPGELRAVQVEVWRAVEAPDSIDFDVQPTTTTNKRGKREPKR